MASIDDSPTSLHGQPWSVWADRLGRDSPLSDTDEQSKINAAKEGDAMKLPKQDMHYYGLCPVRDEFYLVTCNYCQKVCTPQGLKNHIELKHAQEWTNCQQLQLNESVDSGIQLSAGSTTITNGAKSKTSKKAVSGQAPPQNSLAYLLATPAAPLKSRGPAVNKRIGVQTGKPTPSMASVAPAVANVVSHGPANAKIPASVSSALTGTSYDKVPSPQQPPPVQFSPLQPIITAPSPKSPLTASAVGGTMTPSPAITMTVAVDSSGNQTVQIHLPEIGNGVILADSPTDLANSAANSGSSSAQNHRTGKKQRKGMKAERRGIPGKERELDLEKHCGVWIGDVHRACTRSLTCKAHSLTLRRAVQGRSRAFDDLLAEHRAAKEVVLKQLKDGATPPGPPTSQPPIKTNPPVASQPASSLPKLGRPPITRPPPAKKPFTALTLQQQQQQQQLYHHHHQQQQLSSTNELTIEVPTGEGSAQQLPSSGLLQRVIPSAVAPLSLTFSSYHPKPLAVCSFGLKRQLNGAVIANDRKWDFIRTTLRSAFQRPGTANTALQLGTATAPTLHSLLNSSTLRSVNAEFGQLESNTIQLPNGLHLSIGDQLIDVGQHQDPKTSLLNGVAASDQVEATLEDLMEGFDGLVGEDGVLTFLNQTTEGSASLSLMADLSAGNITFSELNQSNANSAGNGSGARMLSSAAAAATGLLLHPDTGDPL